VEEAVVRGQLLQLKMGQMEQRHQSQEHRQIMLVVAGEEGMLPMAQERMEEATVLPDPQLRPELLTLAAEVAVLEELHLHREMEVAG
jgi:hypothetical protein